MPTLESSPDLFQTAHAVFVCQHYLLEKHVLLSYQQMARTYGMISLASAYLAKALRARLHGYKVQCKFLKNGTLELVLTHVNSQEIYAISGVARMNYLNTLAVTHLANFLLSEIETCRTLNLLSFGSRPAASQRKTERCSVKQSCLAARIPLLTV